LPSIALHKRLDLRDEFLVETLFVLAFLVSPDKKQGLPPLVEEVQDP